MYLMKSWRWVIASMALLVVSVSTVLSQVPNEGEVRAKAQMDMKNGNFKEAYDGFRALCLEGKSDPNAVPEDLSNGQQCLQRLGRVNEIDAFFEGTIKAHEKNWRLLQMAANLYLQVPHHGFEIAGQFERGNHRGGGKMVNALERDRVRALQLMQQALPLVKEDDNKADVANFYISLANQLLSNRGFYEAWRLQYLSDLKELPDYEEGYPQYRNFNGAPVDKDGNPIFYAVGKSWEESENDGQRWRWCLAQAVENHPARLNDVRMIQASFAQQQYAPTTMQQFNYGRRFFGLPVSDDDTQKNESGTYALDTLKETETIAKLATGIKRFDLPDDYNYLKIWQQVVAEPKTGHSEEAYTSIATEFENRRQYDPAAKWWKESLAKHGAGPNNWRQQRLEQIVGNWGTFEGLGAQPAGEGATLEFRFRNAEKVKFEAKAIKVEELLTDLKAYLKSDPGQLDWQKIQLNNIGYRLVEQNETKYIGDQVAAWDLELKPREKHFDRRITVSTPLQKGGAYLLTATVPDGNVSKIIVWVADSAIVSKGLDGKHYYYIADAASGQPVAKANLEFFGYQQKNLGGNRFQILTKNFAETADENGQVLPDPRDLEKGYQWLITARTGEGRFAFLGFQGIWYNRYHDQEYNQIKAFGMTDRPVYRPKQTVNFKFWLDKAQYDKDTPSEFAKKSFPVEIYNPKGEKIFDQVLETDEWGGLESKLELPADATLGQYTVNVKVTNDAKVVVAGGNVGFRVEEYKKPEYQVSIDAPTDPVMLGEKITAKITAKYYFGSPVTKAKVKYRIMRSDYSADWYPIAEWDWCYGKGYWWFAYDAPWYPGWNDWCGCRRPAPWWIYRGNYNQPELVAEEEVEIGADGTLEVAIDTLVAKELHPNKDHQYTITAEVRDESRRTIVGTGNVLVARKPFKVYSWVNRGYYRVGDTIDAQFLAQTLDQKPVEGSGELTLFKITYDKDRQPIETPVRRWDVTTGEEGRAQQQLNASAKGQYRLSLKLTDKKEHTIEGGYLFTIIGDGFDGQDYRFNKLELIPEKRDYQPGETVKLQINTNHPDSTVLLFVRPTNGVYLPPKVIHMKGKTTVEEIAVVKKDMPNFFVEALTVADGQVYTETKEIVVPPEKRVLNVAIEPSATEFKPGEKAKVKVHLTDFTGENFVGTSVVSIYDKSVEYISGGSNVADIKDFFWKWRRHHNPSGQNSLAIYSHNMTLPKMPGMAFLGAFGATVADEMDAIETAAMAADKPGEGGGRGGALFGNADRKSEMRAASADGVALAKSAAPAAPGMEMQSRRQLDANGISEKAKDAGGGGDQPAGELVEPTVRSNFADTALWVGSLTTDKTGMAEVDLTMPENLTSWKVKVWSFGHGAKVGSSDVELITRKNLIIRLQAPRFLVQKDEVVLSANVHNYLKTDKEVSVTLDLPEKELLGLIQGEATQKIKIKAGGEQRVDWRVKVTNEGLATVRMKALTNEESDATEMKLPCYIHGMLKMEAWAGTIRPDKDSGKVALTVPAERRIDQSLLEVRYSPSLATAMVDALPYLAEYPYGCTEQTLNRFLPSVITQKTLREMNINLAEIRDKRTNLNAQEIGDDKERAKQWKRFEHNPVFDEEELNRMVKENVNMLTNMQLSDGGWGWFSGVGERSWPHTTAVVVHGLQIAKENDVALVPNMLERGVAWLKNYQAGEVQKIKNADGKINPWKMHADNLDAFVYMVLVDADQENKEMRDFLYRDRIELAVYAKALFGLGLHKVGDQEKLTMIMQNIDQFLVQDTENESAYLKLPANNYWWYWYGSETEANAYYLKLLSKLEPKGEKAPRLVKYLLNNRKHATYWSSTRDTAIAVEAFADYIRATGEDKPDMIVEVWIDGEKKKEVAIKPENLFTYDNKFVLKGADVTDGKHEIEIKRRGKGPVYFNAYFTNFTLEDHITKAGLEIKVERNYYKLNEVDKSIKVAGSRGQAADQKVLKYERVPLKELDTLKSGDLVEVELVIESKNDYEYILFEDMKAAGFEAVDVRSGYTNNGLGAYTEFRDERVAMFVRALARGKHSMSYRLRAEIPGKFSALPTKASAMSRRNSKRIPTRSSSTSRISLVVHRYMLPANILAHRAGSL